jgi:hypothetical protein
MRDITIHYAAGQITLRPEFLPAPRTALLRVLKMAGQAGEADEVAAWACETLDGRAEELRAARGVHEDAASHAREALEATLRAKALAYKDGDVQRYKDLLQDIRELRKELATEISAATARRRQLEMIKRNRDVVEAWEQQRRTL